MIKISKAGFEIPKVLVEDGLLLRDEYVLMYTNSPGGFHLDDDKIRTKFSFCSKIYGHEDVKDLLKHVQNDKCCFCEAKISHIAYGDVEHFRPKAAYKNGENSDYVYPGYYWLCYDWGNLYFSCQICNQRFKGNYFPISDSGIRACSIVRDISFEDPLFLDPGGTDDPEHHIYFDGAIPGSNTVKGKTTIKYLGLDREELNEDRLTSLERLRCLERIVWLTADSMNAVVARRAFLDQLETCVSNWSEYSSMFKSNFSKYLKEI
ncbi:hypothetical protein AQ505_09065 [Pedobacter sp. PACM 27299]|uniref:hypothetical protein n=1 Tax=Pedobacter sp. PACM 27299 TaxID=1727164 RepID=UPI000706D80B|nr:hypothetical protein [Pedobacter sp. PACM 27299]ALL05630.1 hypothetical protein AQ505_09065 [Pedobacter sp. PACM 27299]